jgi:hypothetical protein
MKGHRRRSAVLRDNREAAKVFPKIIGAISAHSNGSSPTHTDENSERRKAAKKWTMPKWMEAYRQFFVNTAGNTIEELVNGNTDPLINLPPSTLEFGMKAQVRFLMNLKEKGWLR